VRECEWSLPLLLWLKQRQLPTPEIVVIDHENREVSFLLRVTVKIEEGTQYKQHKEVNYAENRNG